MVAPDPAISSNNPRASLDFDVGGTGWAAKMTRLFQYKTTKLSDGHHVNVPGAGSHDHPSMGVLRRSAFDAGG